eukprot:TRINITY_DN14933_c0_g1_i1.p1 TRINITY_DN14933_c0_g1~~TRINITY_DN14933_c0_g1_i1.p1  ORF type:complete len:613 (-),score=137.25 TRINITY_DN14933_c0_g1_i1:444-2204(-)
MEQLQETAAAMAATTRQTARFIRALERVADLYAEMGSEMVKMFAAISLSKDAQQEEDMRLVDELLVAWKEVGEGESTLSTRLLDLAKSLRLKIAQSEKERAQRRASAENVSNALDTAVKTAEARKNGNSGGGWFGWMGGAADGAPVASEELIERQRSATAECLTLLGQQMQAAHKQDRDTLAEGLSEARRLAKAVGEKLCVLKPSWRGTSGALSRKSAFSSASASSPAAPAKGGSGKVSSLIKNLATTEGRERLKEASSTPEFTKTVQEPEPIRAPPVEKISQGVSRIRGIYEHQVLKAGLRVLDERWGAPMPAVLPPSASSSKRPMKEKLLRDLLDGTIKLQSVPGNDVSAAQKDVALLQLPQLLRLRVLHLDFTPSGCGTDSVNTVGDRHEGFLSAVDRALFRELGRRSVAELQTGWAETSEANFHALGRDTVFFTAAATAIPQPLWWVWWLSEERSVFINSSTLVATTSFPEGSPVLEVTDSSKADKQDPTGRLRWMDWRVEVIEEQSRLSPTKPDGGVAASLSFCKVATDASATTNASSTSTGEEPPTASAGASTGKIVTADVLKGALSSLRSARSSQPKSA